MTHKASCRLPTKPSQLILLALDDLAKAEKSPAHEILMVAWHNAMKTPEYDTKTCRTTLKGKCQVCLAGSVMAFSLNAPPIVCLKPDDYPEPVRKRLTAINYLRGGDIFRALHELGYAYKTAAKVCRVFGMKEYQSVEVAEYDDDPALFKRQMRALAKKLAALSL